MKLWWITGWVAAGAILLPGGAVALAQDPPALYLQSLAATCAACHGTQGRAVPGAGVPALAGMPRQELVQRMNAYRSGVRPATVMQQISRGYSEAQIERMAGYFANQPPQERP